MSVPELERASVLERLTKGYEVSDENRREAFQTALRTFGSQPGSLASRRLWLPAWFLGAIIFSVFSLGLFLILAPQGEGGRSVWWQIAPLLFVGMLVSSAFLAIFPALYSTYFRTRADPTVMLLCDPGRAFLTVRVLVRPDRRYRYLLKAKNLGAAKRGHHFAQTMVNDLLKRVDDAGNVRIEGVAQSMKLGRDYYRDRLGFELGPGRKISYPPNSRN